jgi:hypothetical protein
MTSDSMIDSLRAGKIDDLGLIPGWRVMAGPFSQLNQRV